MTIRLTADDLFDQYAVDFHGSFLETRCGCGQIHVRTIASLKAPHAFRVGELAGELICPACRARPEVLMREAMADVPPYPGVVRRPWKVLLLRAEG